LVAFDLSQTAVCHPVAVELHDVHAPDVPASVHVDDRMAHQYLNANLHYTLRQLAFGLCAHVDHGGHVAADIGQVKCGLVARIVVGKND
jgi:hypothetical protein